MGMPMGMPMSYGAPMMSAPMQQYSMPMQTIQQPMMQTIQQPIMQQPIMQMPMQTYTMPAPQPIMTIHTINETQVIFTSITCLRCAGKRASDVVWGGCTCFGVFRCFPYSARYRKH